MAASSNPEHLVAHASAVDPSMLFFSAQFDSIEEDRAHWSLVTEFNPALASAVDPSSMFTAQSNSIEEQIEQSKAHWSQVTEVNSDDDGAAETSNVDAFKALQLHPTWGTFFKTFGRGKDDRGELVVGDKFAEGGQAELYKVQVSWREQILKDFAQKHGTEYVLKVFKKGTFLKHLEAQWPQGMLKFYAEKAKTRYFRRNHHGPRYFCDVICGTLLGDGRFAFLMVREKGDLRQTINNIMKHKVGEDSGPFAKGVAKRIIYAIAKGMVALHKRDIIHRDLKASNVLITEKLNFIVADFESSIGVIGTGYFRAPEILQALQACDSEDESWKCDVFTKKADVYAFGMTCYEILSGKYPFEGHSMSNFNHVLEGQRLEIPKYVDGWACKLLEMCWHPNPLQRPSFERILKVLKPTKGEGEVIANSLHESEVILFPKEVIRRKQWDVLSWWRRRLSFSSIPCSRLNLRRAYGMERHHPAIDNPPPSCEKSDTT